MKGQKVLLIRNRPKTPFHPPPSIMFVCFLKCNFPMNHHFRLLVGSSLRNYCLKRFEVVLPCSYISTYFYDISSFISHDVQLETNKYIYIWNLTCNEAQQKIKESFPPHWRFRFSSQYVCMYLHKFVHVCIIVYTAFEFMVGRICVLNF